MFWLLWCWRCHRYEGKQTHDKSKSQIEEWVIKKMFFKTVSNKRVFSRKTLLQTVFVRCFSKYIFILLFFIRIHRKIVMIPKVKKKYFTFIGESKVPLGQKFANFFLSFVRINFHKFVKINKPARQTLLKIQFLLFLEL